MKRILILFKNFGLNILIMSYLFHFSVVIIVTNERKDNGTNLIPLTNELIILIF